MRIPALILTALLFLPLTAGADTVLDFNAFPVPGPFVAGVEDGFSITTSTNSLTAVETVVHGTTALRGGGSGFDFPLVIVTKLGGGAFNLVSLDLGGLGGFAPEVPVRGLLGAGVQGIDTFDANDPSLPIPTFVPLALATLAIDRLEIRLAPGDCDPECGAPILDNIVVRDVASVPTPSVLGLLGVAVAALGCRRVRRAGRRS